jgi:glycosyltransferase involved in cell wall biosynthesis
MQAENQIARYSIHLSREAWDEAHFELRYGDNNRPFHLVFRRKQGRFAINHMRNGTWGNEACSGVFAPELLQDAPVMIDFHEELAFVRIGDTCVSFFLDTAKDIQGKLTAARKNVTSYTWAMPAPFTVSRANESGSSLVIKMLGRELSLPEPAGAALAAFALDGSTRRHSYTNFLASHIFPSRLVVIDMYRESAWSAIAHALLYPCSQVYRLCTNDAERSLVEKVAQANGFADRLHVISDADIDVLLGDLEGGDILLQGEGVFERKQDIICRLPATTRERLHILTQESGVVPVNRVLPSAVRRLSNIQVKVGKYWELNQHAANGTDARVSGLDIVVAAYNVRDYIAETVRSLLCDGRDDVRVLVVNDGSSDGTEALVASEFAGDSRVLVLNKANGGCASARNYGRMMSDRTHIAFVDGDDFVSANMFADLYDLAVYSGYEIVRAGFNFYDASRPSPYYPSYEEDLYANAERRKFGNHDVIQLHSRNIIKGQPTIWRKVYRRDFLDTKALWFPENVRAYDDFIFQLTALTAAGDILMMPDHKYHYRQHPAQDIKQGDERHFYMLHMYHMLLRRSVDEGWPDFYPYTLAIMDSIRWSASLLRPDLVDSFLRACAQFCVAVEKVHGPNCMPQELVDSITHQDFAFHLRKERQRMAAIPAGHHWSYFTGAMEHPDMIRMLQSLQRKI